MRPHVLDVDLENFHLVPQTCARAVFWELVDVDDDVDPTFEKEEWFSSTLLEWGTCGKVIVEKGEAMAFAEYAPAPLFPRLVAFPANGISDDAAYLAYCFVEEGHRGRGLGGELIREVARDLVDRGYRAVESVGDRQWAGDTWVLPFSFLVANGFHILRDDARYPLLRLDLHEVPEGRMARDATFVPLPSG